MRNYNIVLICLTAVISSVFLPPRSFASELESRYFNTRVHESVDSHYLLKKLLDLRYFLDIGADVSADNPNPRVMLNNALDALYLAVSDILDIHMYGFKINLEIVPDRRYLREVLQKHTKKNTDAPSYYYHQKNTIYVSFEDFKLGMLAHEIAHAIISHYFAVPPPENVQEILAGYVEYSINKEIAK